MKEKETGCVDWAAERDEHTFQIVFNSNCISSKLLWGEKAWGKEKQIFKLRSFTYSSKFHQSKNYSGNWTLK